MSKPGYYAIIPANVRYDKDLPANAKLLYGEITALCNQTGFCWANNRYFAELYGVTTRTVSAWISLLSNKGYIKTKGLMSVLNKRQIYLGHVPTYGEKLRGGRKKTSIPIEENFLHNNTVNNTTNNTKDIPQNSIEFELSAFLFKEIQTRKPDFKKPNLQIWAKSLDRMIRLDHRKPARIREVITWCQQDSGNSNGWAGWQNNILSTMKLREKFDKLEMSMGQDKVKAAASKVVVSTFDADAAKQLKSLKEAKNE